MKLVTAVILMLWPVVSTHASEIPGGRQLTFAGEVHEAKDISSVATVGDFLVIGSDEGHVIQILRRETATTYELRRKYTLPNGTLTTRTKKEDPELDIEGIAADGDVVYVVGSHSRKRSKVTADGDNRSYLNNRARLGENLPEEAHRCLYRFELNAEGCIVGDIEETDLYDAIRNSDVLDPFTRIPGKENGIDIEGIAVKEGILYVGFRGPVLRKNWVPVLVTEYSARERYDLRFVNLDGLGIRDMVAVEDGFLILAGPVGDGPGTYELVHWNGEDCIPGEDGAFGTIKQLGTIPGVAHGKPEGIAILSDAETQYEVILVYDGLEQGWPTLLEITK